MTTQSTMIGPPYVRTMAAYNGAMNAHVYAAASRLSDEQRRSAQGAFWGSIHGTLCHLLWADMMWMSRFAGWPKPSATLKESGELIATFEELTVKRQEADGGISAWAATVEDQWLAQNQSWFSGAAQRTVEAPRSMLVMHMFNHQTHHRGQVHALLTRAGQDTGDTDLFLVVPAAPL